MKERLTRPICPKELYYKVNIGRLEEDIEPITWEEFEALLNGMERLKMISRGRLENPTLGTTFEVS